MSLGLKVTWGDRRWLRNLAVSTVAARPFFVAVTFRAVDHASRTIDLADFSARTATKEGCRYAQEFGDKHWKWGIFYVSRDNPKMWVPKRYEIGYKLNFGDRWSWAALTLILIAVGMPLSIPVIVLKLIRLRYAWG